jgi:hypothetical protein
MSYRKLLVLALLAGLVTSTAACSDVTAPETEFCAVTGGPSTCGS